MIPYKTLAGVTADKLRGAHQKKTLVICSQSGLRGAQAADKLQQSGFNNVYSLAGEIRRWKSQGFALVSK